LERTITFRRKALVGNCFGLAGILLGAFLVVFRCGIFLDHANEVVLGLFVFFAGYAGIITGCAYWLKAKQWNEAIVVIGLAPLAIAFVPFVRLLLFANLDLLPVGMFMTSLILVVVVFALPDKSGVGRRTHSRSHRHRTRPFVRSISSLSDAHTPEE
jgi:hypothetical protein